MVGMQTELPLGVRHAGNRRRTEQAAERLLRLPGEIVGITDQAAVPDTGPHDRLLVIHRFT